MLGVAAGWLVLQPVKPNHRDATAAYTWSYVLGIAREHKRALLLAHLVALFAAAASVPIPLLLPLLVDEVLLHKPGALTHLINALSRRTGTARCCISARVLVATLLLRLMLHAGRRVAEPRVHPDRQGRDLPPAPPDAGSGCRRIAMSEYETLGSGTVASHFVTDLNARGRFHRRHGGQVRGGRCSRWSA